MRTLSEPRGGESEGERRHLLDLLRGDSGGRGHRRRLRLHGHRLLHPFFCWLWYLGVAGLWVLEGLESWGSAQGWGVEASATASQSDCVTSWLKCGTCDPKKNMLYPCEMEILGPGLISRNLEIWLP